MQPAAQQGGDRQSAHLPAVHAQAGCEHRRDDAETQEAEKDGRHFRHANFADDQVEAPDQGDAKEQDQILGGDGDHG